MTRDVETVFLAGSSSCCKGCTSGGCTVHLVLSTPSSQLTIYHLLKLFQNDPAVIAGKKNVVSEQYDEMVDKQ